MGTHKDNQYDQIFNELKEEKMNWDFEDFLAKAEKKEEIIPLKPKFKGGTFSKLYWMAASLVLLISMGVFFKFNSSKNIKDQDHLVKTGILKQKEDFSKGNEIVALNINDSVNVVSDSTTITHDEDVLEKILPKRGRIKRQTRPQFVQNFPKKSAKKPEAKNTGYNSNYVIINGQKIENEQEAIDLTKFSFRILSENVSKTVAATETKNSFNTDY
jgi:hypothetical protein